MKTKYLSNAVWMLLLVLLTTTLAGCASPNVITWETASEVNTAGFNVYRGSAAEGPWTQINETLVPPSDDPLQGGSYEFVDAEANSGEVYYYLLEEVELSGAVNRFPPQRLEQRTATPNWLWWVAGIALAVLIGWWMGGRLKKGTKESAVDGLE